LEFKQYVFSVDEFLLTARVVRSANSLSDCLYTKCVEYFMLHNSAVMMASVILCFCQ